MGYIEINPDIDNEEFKDPIDSIKDKFLDLLQFNYDKLEWKKDEDNEITTMVGFFTVKVGYDKFYNHYVKIIGKSGEEYCLTQMFHPQVQVIYTNINKRLSDKEDEKFWKGLCNELSRTVDCA